MSKHSCGGTWVPFEKWNGRYRCDRCGVVGYRGGVVARVSSDKLGEILPYRCSKKVKGQRCPNGATTRRNRVWLCDEHR